ncbi:MAG: nucleoside-diphosphate sugar epimerase/dehydratase, partial [Patescibacteria group bacterium]|nr:nucleoside-diphosphate sugar epimerase/dehydratase [Patescibacteria group bacterium]
NEVSIGNIRDIQVEDLLGRESISLDKSIIQKFIYNKKILITGGAGSIGSELCRQICKFKPSLVLILDQDETGIFYIEKELKSEFFELKIIPIIADITNKEKIDKIFKKFTPDIVFHAAAYKHVPLMEQYFDEAVSNNVFGTRIVAECSIKYNAEKFIFISTDKAVKPSSVMGATKRIGEMICQALNKETNTQFISVRFGNVLGSRGSVIPVFAKQIKKRKQIEITHPEMKRYFMITSEACLLVMTAGAIGQGGEVFVLDMGSPVKILDLAKEMIRLSGLEPDKDIPIVYTGIRPGEKFFEELLTAEEGVIATQNQKIFMAKLSETDKDKINNALIRLNNAINNFDEQEIINIFTEIVPFYKRIK